MTIEEQRKAIEDDIINLWSSIHAWAYLGQETERELIDSIKSKFAQLQAARNQSNNVPVAWMVNFNDRSKQVYFQKSDAEYFSHLGGYVITPLYTSPQQSNALEMAAKTCEGLIDKSLDWDVRVQNDAFKIAADEIRKLIPHPESDGK